MKISSSQQHELHNVYRNAVDRTRQSGSESAAQTGQRQAPADSVELSSHAQLLQKAVDGAKEADVTSRERIEELRQQVQNDTYRVPVAQLTSRLMSELF